jgi:hypothetical protein
MLQFQRTLKSSSTCGEAMQESRELNADDGSINQRELRASAHAENSLELSLALLIADFCSPATAKGLQQVNSTDKLSCSASSHRHRSSSQESFHRNRNLLRSTVHGNLMILLCIQKFLSSGNVFLITQPNYHIAKRQKNLISSANRGREIL